MIQNKLKINDSKTEFLVLTSSLLKQHYNDLNISVGNSRIAPSISARNMVCLVSTLFRLQKVLNTAARILKKIPKFSHITDILKDLHWLPIRQRITFKILLLTYQAYHNTAPDYICELITPYCSARNLRSNDMMVRPCHPVKTQSNLLDLKNGISYPCLFVKVLLFTFLNLV